jgi:hypothetical protein
MNSYGLATILEDHPEGHEFTVQELPLHLTHIDSFAVNMGHAALADCIAGIVGDRPAFRVRALADAGYGPDKDIIVTELELSAALEKLHHDLVRGLETTGAVFKRPQFLQEGYRPHISVYSKRRIQPGDDRLIKDISIVTKVSEDENANRRIVATIPLTHQPPSDI